MCGHDEGRDAHVLGHGAQRPGGVPVAEDTPAIDTAE
jgi:hypothetical protein